MTRSAKFKPDGVASRNGYVQVFFNEMTEGPRYKWYRHPIKWYRWRRILARLGVR